MVYGVVTAYLRMENTQISRGSPWDVRERNTIREEIKGVSTPSRRSFWVDRQNFLGSGGGRGERRAAGELVRRLIPSSLAQTAWNGETGQTLE